MAGHIAALSRFISKLGEKAIPLYQMLKKTDSFVWSDAADVVFEDLKKQLVEPPVLAAPVDKEPLLLYVAANARAISLAIVVERKEAGKEYPVQRTVIISAKCSLSQSRDTRIGRSWYMGFSWQVRSLNNTFKVIPSQWSVLLLWAI